MPIGISSQQDFRRIPVLGLVMEVGAVAPTTPTNGQLWYDTANNKAKVYENGAWVDIFSTAAAGGPAGGDLSGTYPNPTVVKVQNGTIIGNGTGFINGGRFMATNPNLTDTAFSTQKTTGDTASRFEINTGGTASWGTGTGALDTTLSRTSAGVLNISGQNVVVNNDARLTDARPPSGTISGDLAGSTWPALNIAANAVTSAKILDATIKVADTETAFDLGALASAHPTTANVDLNSKKIVNLADPTAATDAATKNYVDLTSQGLDAKASVKAASTANLTLSGAQTVDGVALVAGDRVLVKDQTTVANNGIYTVAAGAWTRATDMDSWAEVPAAFTFVEQGTVNAESGWLSTADQGGTLNTTAIPWVQFSAAGQIVAGGGLTKTGNTLDVGAGAGITVNADTVQVATNGITNAMIADGAIDLSTADVTGTLSVGKGGTNNAGAFTVGGVVYYTGTSGGTLLSSLAGTAGQVLHSAGTAAPTWAAVNLASEVTGTLPLTSGGTGGTSTTTARASLIASTTFTATLGAMTAGVELLINLSGMSNQFGYTVQFFNATTGYMEMFSYRLISTTQFGVTSDIAYAANTFRFVATGLTA